MLVVCLDREELPHLSGSSMSKSPLTFILSYCNPFITSQSRTIRLGESTSENSICEWLLVQLNRDEWIQTVKCFVYSFHASMAPSTGPSGIESAPVHPLV